MSEVQQTESISKRSKEGVTKIPDGATILRKSVNTSVEEIENGFITTKSWDIKYEIKKEGEDDTRTDYVYFSKKWYTKEDPLVLKVTNKSLADAFTED